MKPSRSEHSGSGETPTPRTATPTSSPSPAPSRRTTLIPDVDFDIVWPGRLQRHRAIWEELQFRLKLTEHPNAISVLLRVLLDLSIENYIAQTKLVVGPNDKLALRAQKVAEDLLSKGKVSEKYVREIKKFQHDDRLLSADTLHRYVHSSDFAPSPEHLTALWDALANLIVQCLCA